MSRSQDSRTYTPWHCIVSALASSKLTSSNSTNSNTTSSIWRASKLWKAPMMGRWSNDATSSRMIVTSPTRRWKLIVSLWHLSVKADYQCLTNMRSKELILWQPLCLKYLEQACQISQPSFHGRISSTHDVLENENINHFNNNNK